MKPTSHPKPFQSQLWPYLNEIRRLRKGRATWPAIAAELAQHEHFVSAGALVNILSTDAGDRLLMTSRCYDKLDDGGVYWDYFILTHEGQIVKRLDLPFHP